MGIGRQGGGEESGRPDCNLFSPGSLFHLMSHFHCILPQNPLGDFSELCWFGWSPSSLRGSLLGSNSYDVILGRSRTLGLFYWSIAVSFNPVCPQSYSRSFHHLFPKCIGTGLNYKSFIKWRGPVFKYLSYGRIYHSRVITLKSQETENLAKSLWSLNLKQQKSAGWQCRLLNVQVEQPLTSFSTSDCVGWVLLWEEMGPGNSRSIKT